MQNKPRKTLIAIDGNSLMHRAYYALPSMTSREGFPTGAIHGFLSMLLKLVEKKPDYLLVGFDLHGPTFRHAEYDEYKGGRKPTPDDLREQFPVLYLILNSLGIAICTCERYEADDILGTFSRLAEAQNMDALLVTGDKDALQLITEHTHVLLTKKGISDTVEMDEAELCKAYGLSPERMKDLKGLMGDASDNLPGVPGVGEKTALKLLSEYGDLENVLAHAQEIKGKLGEKIAAFGEQARMCYRLGIIDTNAPITMPFESAAFYPRNMENAMTVLRGYDLNSIANRVKAIAASSPETVTPLPAGFPASARSTNDADAAKKAPEDLHTHKIEDIDALKTLVQSFSKTEMIALHADLERLTLASIEGEEYAVQLFFNLLEPGLSKEEVLLCLKPLLEAASPKKILFDAKKWMHLLQENGITLNGLHFDVMIADYLLHALHPAVTLNALAQERLQRETGGAAALLTLFPSMRDELQDAGLMKLYTEVELPLVHVLYDMEKTGFRLDIPVLHSLSAQFEEKLLILKEKINSLAGEPFNILSPKQLGAILFEKLGLPAQKKTKTGYSTDSDVLDAISDMHEIIPLIQEYRFLAKLKSTFVDGLMQVAKSDGRVHTSFNQNVTATGRISSTEPNLQNIPVRTQLGREIRKAFIPSEGNILVGADYSQIELRILAHISGDAHMIEDFLAGGDFHTHTASEVFSVPLQEVTGEQRSAAKAVNFGIVYGISDFGLAKNLHISRTQAGEYIAQYLEKYPGVKEYMRESVRRGKENGYVTTLLGRRRDLPELKSGNYNTRSFGERVAMNMPIQGTAADIIKLAMVRTHAALQARKLRAKLILQVHDELIIDAPPEEANEVQALLTDCMQNALPLSVPVLADAKSGHSWFETK